MRKLSFLTGLAVGYVIGARAGRERYEQIAKSARDLSQTPAVQQAGRAAKETASTAAARAADVISAKVGDRLPSGITDRVPYLRPKSESNGWDSTAG